MFDTLNRIRYNQQNEKARYSMFVSCCSGRTSTTRNRSNSEENVPSRSGAYFRGFSTICQWLASLLAREWYSGASFSTSWSAIANSIGSLASRHDSSFDYRALPRSTQTSICSLDTRSGEGSHSQPIWYSAFCLDGGEVSQTMGIYTAKTIAPRLRTKPKSCQTMAEERVSKYSESRQTRRSDDLLGRRNGNEIGLSGRAELWTAWADPCHYGDGTKVSMQHDFGYHQSWKAGVYGIRQGLQNSGFPELSSAADTTLQEESFPHYRRTSGAQICSGIVVGQATSKENSTVLLAGLQPRPQSRRISQSRCQDQCCRTQASPPQKRVDNQCPEISVEHSASAGKSTKIFSSFNRSLRCLGVKHFLLPVISERQRGGIPRPQQPAARFRKHH